MKRVLLTLVAAALMILAGSVDAGAQGRQGGRNFDPAQMAKMRVERMKESLKINDEQAAKLLDLYKKESEERAKMFQSGERPDREKMQESAKKSDEEIKKILTPEQYKKYTEQQEQMRNRGNGGGRRN